MKLSLYLHSYITDVLLTYGTLDETINKILDAADEGYFEIENKPSCENRDGANRYNVTVKNDTYLSMLKIYGVKSKAISLRRLVYWFVENEIYNEVGWEPINDYTNRDNAKWNKQLDKVLNELDKLIVLDNDGTISHAYDLIYNCRR